MKKASETYLKGILGWTSDEVVSTDFIHAKSAPSSTPAPASS
jgi:glyceraldehyde 3-phosphate dehydrogenase